MFTFYSIASASHFGLAYQGFYTGLYPVFHQDVKHKQCVAVPSSFLRQPPALPER